MSKRDRGSDIKKKEKKKRSNKRAKVDVDPVVKKEFVNLESDVKNEPSTEEPSASLFDEEKPVFFRKRAKLSISLLPWSLRNCKQSVENSIRKMLLKYSDGLGGILMA